MSEENVPFMIVATPELREPTGFFDKSVVVVLPRDDGGHNGFAVHFPRVDIPGSYGAHAQSTLAGPMSSRHVLGFLSSSDWDWSGANAGGVCIGMYDDTLRLVAATQEGRGPSEQLLCFGYAGWAPGQLEEEIVVHEAWTKIELTAENVFAGTDDLWERLIRESGYDPDAYDVPTDAHDSL